MHNYRRATFKGLNKYGTCFASQSSRPPLRWPSHGHLEYGIPIRGRLEDGRYDDSSKSYYYYNNITKKTQWEHPLDDIYRGLVKKARTESQSISLQDNKEDITYITDDILSLEEPLSNLPYKKLEPIIVGAKKKDLKLSPLKVSPNVSPKRELKLFKQKSEDFALGSKKLSLGFSSFDEEKEGTFDKHPRSLDKSELKIAGGGSIFLKSNKKKQTDAGSGSVRLGKVDPLQELQPPRSILREKECN
ncbi:hypothetical protein NQ318_001489 [Aromia moschata]|uniref:WW domain-containing protein n=1 Tax=Aromia moschata TaxID=1265417 RepID=A0AAV8XD17_9CUCU|nr:hypothetical protein NQ318_001489 [Aromia moschata]